MNKQITIGKVPCTLEEAGYDSLYIERLNKFIMRLIDEKVIQAGSYHLMRHGKLFANNSIGSLDYRFPEKPLMPDSIRRVASITKNFTATAVFMLAEQGYLAIDDPVAMHLSEFDTPVHKSIAIYNLLTHTSGLLPDWGAFETPYDNDWVRHIKAFDGNWIKAMLTVPPHCKPNTEWVYSSFCFCFLGEIVKRISGKTIEEFVMENIIKPLGMKDTFYDLPKELHDRVCVACEHEIPKTREDKKQNIDSEKEAWSKIPRGGWGLCSTLSDINLFAQMMLNNGILNGERIIGRKSVENLTHTHLFYDNLRSYCWGQNRLYEHGLGFEVMSKKPWHNMSSGSFGHEGSGVCWYYVDPKEDFIATMFLPYHKGEFNIRPIHRSKYIVWGGLL